LFFVAEDKNWVAKRLKFKLVFDEPHWAIDGLFEIDKTAV
jgi:hypothetical protein